MPFRQTTKPSQLGVAVQVHQPPVAQLVAQLVLPPGRQLLEAAGVAQFEREPGQQALGFELRSAVSLGELLRDAGRSDEARREVEAVYRRFEEGFGLGDLSRAERLLRELGALA